MLRAKSVSQTEPEKANAARHTFGGDDERSNCLFMCGIVGGAIVEEGLSGILGGILEWHSLLGADDLGKKESAGLVEGLRSREMEQGATRSKGLSLRSLCLWFLLS